MRRNGHRIPKCWQNFQKPKFNKLNRIHRNGSQFKIESKWKYISFLLKKSIHLWEKIDFIENFKIAGNGSLYEEIKFMECCIQMEVIWNDENSTELHCIELCLWRRTKWTIKIMESRTHANEMMKIKKCIRYLVQRDK